MIALIGCQELRPQSSEAGPHGRFVARSLPKLADGRCLGFQGMVGEWRELELLLVEVDRVEAVPPGMVAWEIKGSRLSIFDSSGPKPVATARLRWSWRDTSFGSPRPWIGEPLLAGGPATLPARLTLTSLSWISASGTPAADAVRLQEYDPSWPRQYKEFERSLWEAFGANLVLRVEHYGSTAIPGMPAKPIIDVLVEVADLAQARRRLLPRLNRPQWEYWWYIDHPMFVHRSVSGERSHHVHLATHDHRLWEGIGFRDYLRTHPEAAAEYARLKRSCADSCRGDREAYTAAKESFVHRIAAVTRQRAGAR